MATKDISDRQVCEAVAAWQAEGRPFADERLFRATGQAQKVCEGALERAYGRGLIEYGVSIRSAWLTDAGRALLAKNETVQAKTEAAIAELAALDPMAPQGSMDDLSCVFCGADTHEPHYTACLWLRAKALAAEFQKGKEG
jgi:hypothetical protein